MSAVIIAAVTLLTGPYIACSAMFVAIPAAKTFQEPAGLQSLFLSSYPSIYVFACACCSLRVCLAEVLSATAGRSDGHLWKHAR